MMWQNNAILLIKNSAKEETNSSFVLPAIIS